MVRKLYIASAAILATVMLTGVSRAASDDACTLLTQAEVSAALGSAVKPGEPILPTDHKVCTWNATASGVGFVTMSLQSAQSFDRARQQAPALAGAVNVTSVAGLGEGAMYVGVGDNVGLVVKKAGVSFKVAVYKHGASLDEKRAAEKTLAAKAVGRL
jgi:hypothetical protein